MKSDPECSQNLIQFGTKLTTASSSFLSYKFAIALHVMNNLNVCKNIPVHDDCCACQCTRTLSCQDRKHQVGMRQEVQEASMASDLTCTHFLLFLPLSCVFPHLSALSASNILRPLRLAQALVSVKLRKRLPTTTHCSCCSRWSPRLWSRRPLPPRPPSRHSPARAQ